MRRTIRWMLRGIAIALTGVLLLGSAPKASAQRRIVIVRPAPFWGPGPYWGPYWGYYPGDYISANYGFVKVDKHHQDKNDSVYVDGGFAAKLKDAGKFALRPGNYNIEVRDPSGHSIFQERVAVMVGKTTKVEVPS